MKYYALLILLSVALAGCSSSLKGSVGSTSTPEPSKTGSNMTASK
ncbi:putative periplasmic lipoprotein [Candidatus Chlorobium masyuteum]|nr:hypothetical protein [Candidatus Chlorobium masyuteum]